MKYLVLILSLLVAVPASADTLWVRGGVLCNTLDELHVYLTAVALEEDVGDTSCGNFVPRTPIPMEVTLLDVYETPVFLVQTARFYHEASNWTQYGWVGFQLIEQVIPKGDDA